MDSLSPIDVPPPPPVQAGSEFAVTLAADFIGRDFWNRGRPCRDENHVGTRCIILGLHVELAEFGRDTRSIDVVVGEIEFDTAGWMGAQVLQGTVIDLL